MIDWHNVALVFEFPKINWWHFKTIWFKLNLVEKDLRSFACSISSSQTSWFFPLLTFCWIFKTSLNLNKKMKFLWNDAIFELFSTEMENYLFCVLRPCVDPNIRKEIIAKQAHVLNAFFLNFIHLDGENLKLSQIRLRPEGMYFVFFKPIYCNHFLSINFNWKNWMKIVSASNDDIKCP